MEHKSDMKTTCTLVGNHLAASCRGQGSHAWYGESTLSLGERWLAWLGVPALEDLKGACWSGAKKGDLTELAPFFTSLLTDSDQT